LKLGLQRRANCLPDTRDAHVQQLTSGDASLAERMHPQCSFTKAEVVHACRNRMARHVEDVLARRSRLLLLDARAAIEAAPIVARIMRTELKRDDAWERAEVDSFATLARGYLLR
jgi:glycerol-3-phosphate dehydrogenase